MTPTTAMKELVAQAILDSLDPAHVFKLQLSKTTFDEGTLEGFEEADFEGYGAKTISSWDVGTDAVINQVTIDALPPVGGYRFEANNTFNGTQSIFGYKVRNMNTSEDLGAFKFGEPIDLSHIGDSFTITEPARFVVSDEALS